MQLIQNSLLRSSPSCYIRRMNLKPGINIFTGHIRTGKTSLLMELVKGSSAYCGILTPDKGESRQLYTICTDKYYDFQLPEKRHEADPVVGEFIFDKEVFDLARIALLADAMMTEKILVIDEIGKLELTDEGLEPALTQVIAHLKQQGLKRTSVIVVRDGLLPAVVSKYGLEEANIINHLEA